MQDLVTQRYSEIIFYELQDGEYIVLEQSVDGEFISSMCMTREVAIQMAHTFLKTLEPSEELKN